MLSVRLIVFGVLVGIVTGQSLQLKDVIEPCSGNFITHDYNGWDLSNATIDSTFYVPLTNKYTALMISLNLFETIQFESINDAQLEAACLSGRRITQTLNVNITGYNGDEKTLLNLTPTTTPKLFRFNFHYPGFGISVGYASVAFSNNNDWTILDLCFDNGSRGFIVLSTAKKLDENSRNIIVAHMKSLGFQEKHFVDYNYDVCTEKDGILVSNLEDLPKPIKLETLGYNSILTNKLIVPSFVVG